MEKKFQIKDLGVRSLTDEAGRRSPALGAAGIDYVNLTNTRKTYLETAQAAKDHLDSLLKEPKAVPLPDPTAPVQRPFTALEKHSIKAESQFIGDHLKNFQGRTRFAELDLHPNAPSFSVTAANKFHDVLESHANSSSGRALTDYMRGLRMPSYTATAEAKPSFFDKFIHEPRASEFLTAE